jgi:hypothetical protein
MVVFCNKVQRDLFMKNRKRFIEKKRKTMADKMHVEEVSSSTKRSHLPWRKPKYSARGWRRFRGSMTLWRRSQKEMEVGLVKSNVLSLYTG